MINLKLVLVRASIELILHHTRGVPTNTAPPEKGKTAPPVRQVTLRKLEHNFNGYDTRLFNGYDTRRTIYKSCLN